MGCCHQEGEIFLAKEGINPNTPLHEYTHAFMLALSKENPERYDSIVRDLKTSDVWEEVKNDESYASIVKNPARLASEVAARIVGRESEKRASEGITDKVMRAIQNLLDYIKEKIGWKEPLTPRQLTDIVIKDIANPVNIFRSRFDAPEAQKFVNNIPSPIYDLLSEKHGKEYADVISKAVDMSMHTAADGEVVVENNHPTGLLTLDRNYLENLAKAASLVSGENYSFEVKDNIYVHDSYNHANDKLLDVPEDMKDYVESLHQRDDLMSGNADFLPEELGKHYSAWENETEKYISMRESGLASIVDVKAQRNHVSAKFKEYRDAFNAHLGIGESLHGKSVGLIGERYFAHEGEKQNQTANYAFYLVDIVRKSVGKDIDDAKESLSLNHVEMMAVRGAKPNVNINDLIFSRTQPDKKLEIIKGMSDSEIMRLTEDSATKMVKDAGRNMYKSRDKELYISRDNRAGNEWNSTIDSFYTHKGKLHLSAYIQYENTDTSDSESYGKFFRSGNYEGQFKAYDRRGNERYYYFTYDEHDKANVLRSLILEYVNVKYAEKLKKFEEKKLEEKNAPKVAPKAAVEVVKNEQKVVEKAEQKVEPKEESKPQVAQERYIAITPKYQDFLDNEDNYVFTPQMWYLTDNEKDCKDTVHYKISQEKAEMASQWLDDDSVGYDLANGRARGLAEKFSAFDMWNEVTDIASPYEQEQVDRTMPIVRQDVIVELPKAKLSENKLLYDRICDEAEKKITDAGYDHGYAEDLGIGLGEYIYDKNPDNDLNHFEFITPEGSKFEALYDTLFDEVSFTRGEVRGGMYEVSVENWMESLDSKLNISRSKSVDNSNNQQKESVPTKVNQDNQQNKMAKKNYTPNADGRSAEDRALDKFAELMIQKVETLQGDWKKPWFTPGAAQPPKNLSGRQYNGMNSIILMMQQETNGWETNRYATFDRITALNFEKTKDGGRVPATDAEGNKLPQVSINKGEKSTPVFLTVFNVVDPETKERINYDDYKRLTEEERAKYNVYPKLQVYNVFNLDQTNLKESRPEMYEKFLNETKGEIRQSGEDMTSFPAIDTMIDKNLWYCPIKPTRGDDAFYSISKDEIVIPEKEQFIDGESFYSNLLHEMTHSLGADGRLNRLKPSTFGSEAYAREELVAELTAALVSSQHGMEKHVKEDSAAYLRNWIDSLKKSPDFIKTTLMDVKKASSVINNRIDAVNVKIEQGEKADYSDIREQNKSFSASFSNSSKPTATQHNEEQQPVSEEKQQQVSQSNTEAAKASVQSYRHR